MAETKGYITTSDEKGSVNISHGVVATIAAAAVSDISGVYSLYQHPGKELIDAGGKKGISKGVKITIEDGEITIDVFLIAKVDYPVNEVAAQAQKAVISAIEEAVGLKVTTVNINICGVSMKKPQSVRVQSGKPAGAARSEAKPAASADAAPAHT